VVIKDHDNSGYVWEGFFCLDCLNSWIMNHEDREVLYRNLATPATAGQKWTHPPSENGPTQPEIAELK
jgi:hypothetical protein